MPRETRDNAAAGNYTDSVEAMYNAGMADARLETIDSSSTGMAPSVGTTPVNGETSVDNQQGNGYNLNKGTGKIFVDNPFNNTGNLKSNVKYQSGEFNYRYETDSLGRLEVFQTDNLGLTERTERLPHNSKTPGKLAGDHAGHLAGDRFGGSPNLDNLVSQSSDINLSQYKKIENLWANAIKMGKKVKVDVKVKYANDNARPTQFIITYEIDGKPYTKVLIN